MKPKNNCLECGEVVSEGDNICSQCYFNNGFDNQ